MDTYKEGTLYILGNGFDTLHGLDTSVNQFVEILKTKDIYGETETADVVFERYNVLWGDYESCLADIDLDLIAEEEMMAPDYLSDYERDRNAGIYHMQQYTESLHFAIQESLEEMVDAANEELDTKEAKLKDFLEENDAVLSFNYTSTLEELYKIPKNIPICHIHGFRENGEKLLLGFREGMTLKEYNNKYFDEDKIKTIQEKMREIKDDDGLSEEEKREELDHWEEYYENLTANRDYYMDKQREEIFDFYLSLKKEIQVQKLKKFLERCKGIKRIVVMGHSMSEVDRDYMERIERKLQPQEWNISQHNGTPSREELREYSFFDKIKFLDLNQVYAKK